MQSLWINLGLAFYPDVMIPNKRYRTKHSLGYYIGRRATMKMIISPKISTMIFLLLITCSFSNNLFAQNTEIRFSNLFEGQSVDAITAICQDKKGIMWFGTISGIYKYNGVSLKKYVNDAKDSSSISGNYIRKIILDHSGNLWIGTREGLNLYDRDNDNFIRFFHNDGDSVSLPDNYINDILEDKEGRLWVATEFLSLYNPDTRSFSTFKINPGRRDYFKFLYEDSKNNLWFVSLKDLYHFDRKTRQFIHVFDGSGINADLSWYFTDMVQDEKNKYWLTTNKAGLISFSFDHDIKELKRFVYDDHSKTYLSDYTLPALILDRKGNLWLASENAGLFLFDRENEKIHRYISNNKDPNSISCNSIWSIYEDNTGRLWIGTFSNGISIIDPFLEKFRNNQYNEINKSISNNNVSSFLADENGNIWIGTDGGGLNYYNPQKGEIKFYKHNPGNPNSLNRDAILALCYDDLGNLWMGTWDGGVNILKKGSDIFTHYTSSNSNLFNNNIFAIANDRKGKMYVGSFNNGLFIYDIKSGQWLNYIHLPGDERSISDDYIFCLYSDKDNNLWIGTMYGGLDLLQHDNHGNVYFTSYRSDPKNTKSISNNQVQTIFEDNDGQLWIGTSDGLNSMNKNTGEFVVYREKDGLPNNSIEGILGDDRGNLWISTFKGMSKFDKETHSFRNYNINDGLQGDQFNRNAVLKARSGLMYFGGTNGINVFNPDSVRDNPFPPKIILTDFKLFNKSVTVGKNSPLKKNIDESKSITLNYGQSVFSIEYAALNYTHPENNQYAFRMEGLEKDWNYVGNQMNATYTNLDPGKYIFRVKAANNDGIWNNDGVSLTVFVKPPMWETWWFRIILIAVLVSLIYWYTSSRLKQSSRQKEILKKLVLKKTDEIVKQYADLERKNAELNRKQLENLEMSEKLREVDEIKLKFFANISHEFRTPLTLIVGPAENLIKDKNISPEIHDQINLIYKNGNRLLRLMNDLLDFQKIDNDSMKVRLLEGDMAKFIAEVVNTFSDLAIKRGIKLLYTTDKNEYKTLFDPDKIEIILYNLISNALKYTTEGGEIKVTFLDQLNHNRLQIVVEDNGIGIDKKNIENIFDRYFQIESSPNANYGSGIGLALTKELIELMDGQIAVLSVAGEGTTFTVTLPVYITGTLSANTKYSLITDQKVVFNDQRISQYIQEENGHAKLKGVNNNRLDKILIVDDNDDLRDYIHNCLKDIYTIIEARNGQEGIILAKTKVPQLIISDIMMPEMDGIEFCRRIKSDIATSHIPVILVTAKTSLESQLEGFHEGADEYLVKPFQKDLLLVRIQNLIATRKKLREAFKSKIDIEPHDIAVTSVDEKFIQKAFEIIERNIADPDFGSPQLVAELGLSRTFIHLKFKKLTNFSTGEFIKNVRLKRAGQLLKQKKHRISEVGYMVGFADPKYFSKSFKLQFGCSPAQFVTESE